MNLHPIRYVRLAVVLLTLSLVAPAVGFSQTQSPGGHLAPSLCRQGTGWFSADKLCHFGVSAVGAAGLYGIGRVAGLSGWQSAAASAVIMGSLGIWREIGTTDPADPLTRQNLSRKDLLWDGLGIVVGISTGRLVEGLRR